MLYKCVYRAQGAAVNKLDEAAIDINFILGIHTNNSSYVELVPKEKMIGNYYALGTVEKVTEEINELKRLSRENW